MLGEHRDAILVDAQALPFGEDSMVAHFEDRA